MFNLKFIFKLISAAFICFIISSCSHVKKGDGPPSFYVDETKIPDAVPKVEPLARYGNLRSYQVFGHRYYPMKSAKNYEAVGVASWYGTKFNSLTTSSGERYNMLAMTAAHKTLPLPTYVEVTNLKNHRKIIVKVNDRGPFESNRIIDLSYVAAKKLDMLGHGTAVVKIKAIDPYTFGKANDFFLAHKNNHKPINTKPVLYARHYPAFHPTYTYTKSHKISHQLALKKQVYLQVGAFKNKTNALRLQQKLIGLLSMPVKIANLSGKGLYHVQVGPIRDASTVDKIKLRLKGIGFKTNQVQGA